MDFKDTILEMWIMLRARASTERKDSTASTAATCALLIESNDFYRFLNDAVIRILHEVDV
jgi:hypothetical protein